MSQGAVSKSHALAVVSQVSDRAVRASVLDPTAQRPFCKLEWEEDEGKVIRVFLYTYEEFFQGCISKGKNKSTKVCTVLDKNEIIHCLCIKTF